MVPGSPGSPTYLTNVNAVKKVEFARSVAAVVGAAALVPNINEAAVAEGEQAEQKFIPMIIATAVPVSAVTGAAPAASVRAASTSTSTSAGRDGGGGHGEGQSGDDVGEAHFGGWDGNI